MDTSDAAVDNLLVGLTGVMLRLEDLAVMTDWLSVEDSMTTVETDGLVEL